MNTKKRQISFFIVSIVMVATFLTGCTTSHPQVSTLTPVITTVPTEVIPDQLPTYTPFSTTTPAPSPLSSPAPKPTPAESSDIEEILKSSVVQVESPRGVGVGFFIENGYIVTSADVTWPFDVVEVVLYDGRRFKFIPVIQRDLIADIAVIGPLSVGEPQVKIDNGTMPEVGDTVLLLSNRNREGQGPAFEIAEKEVVDVWKWEKQDFGYFKIKALSSELPSGGLIFSPSGMFLGFSNFSLVDGLFGYMLSGRDAVSRARDMLDGKDVDELDRDLFARKDEAKEIQRIEIPFLYSAPTFVIWEKPGTKIHFEILEEDKKGFSFTILNVRGITENLDIKKLAFEHKVDFTTHLNAPYFLNTFSFSYSIPNAGVISADHALIPYDDPDDNIILSAPHQLIGNCDFPYDRDIFLVSLLEGQHIQIRVESAMIDPAIVIMDAYPQKANQILAESISDDPIGAVIDFTAPRDGDYLVVIASKHGSDIGAYFLSAQIMGQKTVYTVPGR